MEVFPAFDLPMMSTLNWIFGTRGAPDGGDGAGAGAGVDVGTEARDRTGDGAGSGDRAGVGVGVGVGVGAGAGDRAGDGAGAGGGGEGAGTAAGVGAGAGDNAGDDAGTGEGEGDGTRQQILCFTPIARKCCEKKDCTRRNPDLDIIHPVPSYQLTSVRGYAPHATSFHQSFKPVGILVQTAAR